MLLFGSIGYECVSESSVTNALGLVRVIKSMHKLTVFNRKFIKLEVSFFIVFKVIFAIRFMRFVLFSFICACNNISEINIYAVIYG